MLRTGGTRLRQAATATARAIRRGSISQNPVFSSSVIRLFVTNGLQANSVARQMINYALSHARSQKSEESYAQGLLVLEQCLSANMREGAGASTEDSRGMVQLAMSTLLSERGDFKGAIEKLQEILDFAHSSLGVRVAAMEALVGLHLEMGQDDTSSVLANKCLQLLRTGELQIGSEPSSEVLETRVKAVKGLVELVLGNFKSAEPYLGESKGDKECCGNVALSCGEFLHATGNLSLAKELYKKAIQVESMNKDFDNRFFSAACNMVSDEVLLGANCALGQLEAHLGNFGDAEEILTRALTETEELFGSHHPKVGVVLTCVALMYKHKAKLERSSSILIQEGLYRKAIDLLKAPPLETEGAEVQVDKRDIIALARGGYAETLCVQENRKGEGESMKRWAENAWRNRRLSLAEALEISDPSRAPIIDARISRVL